MARSSAKPRSAKAKVAASKSTKSASRGSGPKASSKSRSKASPRAAEKMPATRLSGRASDEPAKAELLLTHDLMNRVSTAMMVVNTDFIVQYVNKATMDLFARHADSFRKLFPTFDPTKIVGACIDQFHKVPSHQRAMLSNPRNLPVKTDITVGDAKIQLHVTPITDDSGRPSGFALEWSDVTTLRDSAGQIAAVSKSQAVIEFSMDGKVLTANENFLAALGYTLDEIVGKHHSFFVERSHAESHEYRQFWESLNGGKYNAGEYKRIGKGGKEVWIQATYNPIVDLNGRPFKVVKYAVDITSAKLRNADYEGQLAAINKAQATIEFSLDGKILKANENFLNAVGYSANDVIGQHHSMFVPDEYARSLEYREFWQNLRAGKYHAAEFARRGRGGKTVWIQASYNPIYDVNGVLSKIVKYATDITEAKERQLQMENEIRLRQEEDARTAEVMRGKVAEVLKVVNAVADGNFDIIVPDLGDDAVGQVASALSTAVVSMRTALLAVQSVSSTVASAATQMTSASGEISKGAQHQASSLEETASSLEEITSTVKQNTDNAQQARQLANNSRDVAEKGGVVLTDAIKAMGEINQASTKISDIITTIDEIAFQTNLLALNAAVEAARAGEQGRGFAVVASEVRNLSQRSALAAKEIKTLIQDSVRKVENGTSLVNQSGKTLEEIVVSVKRVTDIVAEIAAASKEQLTGIEQVNKAVAQMDRVTQSNASQTEEMAGTAESLLGHSQQLRDLVSKFKLEADGATSTSHQVRQVTPSRFSSRQVETDIEKVTSRLGQMAGTGAGFVEF
jgi:methyl-accepting chemotaxis protein